MVRLHAKKAFKRAKSEAIKYTKKEGLLFLERYVKRKYQEIKGKGREKVREETEKENRHFHLLRLTRYKKESSSVRLIFIQ